jgi:hypothetical protein
VRPRANAPGEKNPPRRTGATKPFIPFEIKRDRSLESAIICQHRPEVSNRV